MMVAEPEANKEVTEIPGKHVISRMWLWWFLTSVIGGVVGETVAYYVRVLLLEASGVQVGSIDIRVLIVGPLILLIAGAVGGAVGGAIHWLFVRRSIEHSMRWILKCSIGGATVFLGWYAIMLGVDFLSRNGPPERVYVSRSAASGAIVGVGLAWILRETRPKA